MEAGMKRAARRKVRTAWVLGLLVLTAGVAALGGCGEAEADPPVTEDELPEDIYSVQQTYQAHYDSVMLERETLLETVLAGTRATRAYRDAKDARGASFAADGVVQDHIERCVDLTGRMEDETIPETIELLLALNDGRVGIERFKLRFARFDGDWVETNDCWRGLWADATFAAWRARWAAQTDSMSREETARRVAAEAARRRVAEAAACIADFTSRFRFVVKPLRGPGPRQRTLRFGSRVLGEYVEAKNGPGISDDSWMLVALSDSLPAWMDAGWWQTAAFPVYARTGEVLAIGPRTAMIEQWTAAGRPGCAS